MAAAPVFRFNFAAAAAAGADMDDDDDEEGGAVGEDGAQDPGSVAEQQQQQQQRRPIARPPPMPCVQLTPPFPGDAELQVGREQSTCGPCGLRNADGPCGRAGSQRTGLEIDRVDLPELGQHPLYRRNGMVVGAEQQDALWQVAHSRAWLHARAQPMTSSSASRSAACRRPWPRQWRRSRT